MSWESFRWTDHCEVGKCISNNRILLNTACNGKPGRSKRAVLTPEAVEKVCVGILRSPKRSPPPHSGEYCMKISIFTQGRLAHFIFHVQTFFLWGHLKKEVFRTSCTAIPKLKDRIRTAVGNVPGNTLYRVMASFQHHLDECVVQRRHHIQKVIHAINTD
ncbi:hypothetical protein X975_22720, partial [Stegodyphus mimosarum]